ncbi:MAG: hypothetical protein ACLQQ4_18505 [Bacteroidia bacterium]
MYREFTTAFTRSGNMINPDHIIVTDEYVKWEKRNSYLIGKDSKSIPINRIASVDIHNKGFGTNIKIQSFGEGTITAENFSISDAKELKTLLESMMGSNAGSANDTVKIPEEHVQTSDDVLNTAMADELELELKYKEKDLEREERRKAKLEREENLKSSNAFVYCLKWIWIVLLSTTWRKILAGAVLLLLINWAYNTIPDKMNIDKDRAKIIAEKQRLEAVKTKVNRFIGLKDFDSADMNMNDMHWQVSVKNQYLVDEEDEAKTRWNNIDEEYYNKIESLKESHKGKGKAK